MERDISQNVQELHQWRAAAEEKFHTLFRISGEQTEALKEATEATNALRVELKVFVATLSGYKPCPLHGSCSSLEERVDALEEARAEARGGWKVVAAIGSAGGILGSLLTWALGHVSLHP